MEMELESIMLPGIDPQRPIVIAGPCSAETEEQVMETARGIADKGIKLFRAGIWKPRTKPGGFEGIGAEGLQWLKRVKKETGMYVATEVATKDHVFEALKAGIDVLWIGARTTVNPFAVQEIADALKGVDVPVLIKNPVNPDLELWIGAFQRLYGAGIRRLGAIHRGFSSHRRKARTGSSSLPAGYGLEFRWFDHRIALQPRLRLERRFTADHTGCIGLRSEFIGYPRLQPDNGKLG